MSEELEREQLEATIQDEELELDLNLDGDEESEPSEELVPKSKFLQAIARAKKAEAKLKESKPEPKKFISPKSKIDESFKKDIEELKIAEKKRQIGYKLGLSPDETDRLFKFSGGEDPEEAYKDPFFQGALNAHRKEKSVEEAIPSSSNKTLKVEGKTFAEMTEEERKANWGKFLKK